ncbi:glycoside hydrolase family 38 C-terminal domain-containing protein [Opitutus sp. ER46]|uniref:alpha-mannosidase n=1 Tax=Opitutus sp. ER46 TaxID=2161864 RepID=UPI001E425BFA|nr:glycoside hydrolase family 38 C-terminal domain-containing protein [Opitutus sp. ER46]
MRKVHYVLSTHWDREWYQTFQDYRRRLVRLMDRVLDDLESGALRGPFTTDGQAIVIEDYLEIRPERRTQLERLARAGRFMIGPWYVLPDEWLVSGEALIRNLRQGRRVARAVGGRTSDAGFVCDLFGHIGQLPQLLRQFGIKGALVWRGLEPRRQALLRWRGADGTEVPAYRFGRCGYCDFANDVRYMSEPRRPFTPAQALADLKAFLAKEAARTPEGPLLIFDGADHLEYDAEHYAVLFNQPVSAEFPYEIVHSTLDAYLEEAAPLAQASTEVVTGELRQNAMHPAATDAQGMIPGTLSSRVRLKQANAECQTLLCAWAEPFSVLATVLTGSPVPQGYLDAAWRWLLQNHPHDSICGCSIDEVHEDMKYRFAQARQIAQAQTTEALQALAASVGGTPGERELRVLVANAAARPVAEPATLVLPIPAEWGTFQEFMGYEPKPAFRVFDARGEELPYQLVALESGRAKSRLFRTKFPEPYRTNDATIVVRLTVPGLGYTTLTVREGPQMPKAGPFAAAFLPTRHPVAPGLATSERAMANAFLAVQIESNGSLTVTDRRTGQSYSRLLTFEDIADIGDGWYHGPAVNDQRVVSTGAHADVALVQNGPLVAQFRVRMTMNVPAEFDHGRHVRAERWVPLVVDSLVTLRADVARVEVTSRIDNQVKDHRLRVLFPTGAAGAQTYFADGAFDVVERRVGLPADNHLARELAVETTPQQSWTAVAADGRGLAVVAPGLFETAVLDTPERPIALTLFRAVRRTFLTDGQPDGQMQGPLEFSYWILPQAGSLDGAALAEAGQRLAAGLRTTTLTAQDVPLHRAPATIAVERSLLTVPPGVALSSVCPVGDDVEVRIYNPASAPVIATLGVEGDALPATHATALVVDLDGAPLGAPMATANGVPVTLKPKQILTLRFRREPEAGGQKPEA